MTPSALKQNRPLLLATIVVFAGGLIGAWHHQATASHGFCSDHGALIHLEDGPRSSEAGPAGASSLQSREHVAGDHDCGVLAFLGQSLLRIQGQAVGLDASPSPLLLPAGQRSPPPQLDPLSRSPKQSPPRG